MNNEIEKAMQLADRLEAMNKQPASCKVKHDRRKQSTGKVKRGNS